MPEPTEEELLENTRKLFANHKPTSTWYHSILDPEAKVIVNFDEGKLFIRDKKMWQDFVSNTWINPNPSKNKK